MYSEWRTKTPAWEGDIFGRLTPPPEDILAMKRGLLNFSPNIFEEESNCEQTCTIEEEDLLDLEFDTVCPRDVFGFKCGPTLAELNDTRSRSPLINPEMKRLHQVAILTVADTDDEPMCEGTSAEKAQSGSVLEQQLRTQQTASVYHEQHLPGYSKCSTAVSSTVSRSESIPIPIKRDPKLAQSVCLSPPSPQERKPFGSERKPFEHFYSTQGVQQHFSAPQFTTSYSSHRGEIASSSYSAETVSSSQLLQQQASQTSASHEQVANRAAANAYQSESDEDDEIDSEVEDMEEEYCPFQKEGKIQTRRKGRKSESEDMVPNPLKLLKIGRELDNLNKIISSLKPINEVPQHSRGRSRREKNKLASRACRLKKKQQHEANKVKLHGLQSEQENLMFLINDMKNEIVNRAQYPRKHGSSLSEKFKHMAKKAFDQPIAGHTSDYVREVLREVAKGNKTGGLTLRKSDET
ncbi:CREB3 regulatory factor-like [Dendronephthya gigantea]|uniref:CREB3 regulatory factor-like n=1 Tax=Dendronephthya gigantea TaxID=151771 RepID=UPI00106C8034|nr:CREB3 regulatory factor-like [Dendronephthya gigantea]